jgi:hypothetical protein
MRTKLLATVAVAALIGCTTVAMTQEAGKEAPGKSAVHPQGGPAGQGGAIGHAQQAPGGAMGNAQQKPGGSAQNQGMDEHPAQGLSQGAEHGNTAQRGAPDNEPGKAGVNGQGGTQENAQTQERGGQNQNAATSSRTGGKSVQLSEQQRTQIKGMIGRGHDVARVNNVNFNISVGTAVPRDVHIAVLPADVVTLVPEYRGFEYIVVGDQLLIIDPDSLEIVAILPA